LDFGLWSALLFCLVLGVSIVELEVKDDARPGVMRENAGQLFPPDYVPLVNLDKLHLENDRLNAKRSIIC